MKTPCIATATRASLGVLLAGLLLPLALMAEENRITPNIQSVQVMHNGEMVTIERGSDRDATLPETFQKTDRGCPPFCVQPMEVVPGVETIGEIDMLGYLQRMTEGDDSILVIDSRTPDWVMRGTIPGSVNIPWTALNKDGYEISKPLNATETFVDILVEQFGASQDPATKAWSFDDAKTLVLFCNGIWCPQSSINIMTLNAIGYPVQKMKWYRGGMQDWVSVGLTTVEPE
jgi:rhodanese-related sulfurtransferase